MRIDLRGRRTNYFFTRLFPLFLFISSFSSRFDRNDIVGGNWDSSFSLNNHSLWFLDKNFNEVLELNLVTFGLLRLLRSEGVTCSTDKTAKQNKGVRCAKSSQDVRVALETIIIQTGIT